MLKWNDMEFKLKTEHFEGPLDLLLTLIEKRKLLINDIALAKVTDDYLSHVENLPSYSIGDRADFIVIASTLLLIKSRSLLPSLSLTDEEQMSIEDLETRLKLYQKVKDLSLHIKNMYGEKMIFFPNEKANMIQVFSPHQSITIPALVGALQDAIKRLPVKVEPPQAKIKKVISLEEMIDKLTDRIKGALRVSFHEFSGKNKTVTKEEKVEVIVSFLAMLELVKQGVIDVMQEMQHGDIKMETQDIATPRYS